jgi:hypothetical protein
VGFGGAAGNDERSRADGVPWHLEAEWGRGSE